jgi:uncharacterized membrane protein
MIPHWFTVLSILMLVVGAICALWIVIDILAGNWQHMAVMNVVWPVVALFGTLPVLWAYYMWAGSPHIVK